MKIAYIDSELENDWSYTDKLFQYAADNGINIDSAEKKDLFEDLYGPLNKYNGLVAHLGIKKQQELDEIAEKYPNLKIALISPLFSDYSKDKWEEGNIKIFNANIPEDIFEYFKK